MDDKKARHLLRSELLIALCISEKEDTISEHESYIRYLEKIRNDESEDQIVLIDENIKAFKVLIDTFE